jgi:exosortase/archaeosortase family protein
MNEFMPVTLALTQNLFTWRNQTNFMGQKFLGMSMDGTDRILFRVAKFLIKFNILAIPLYLILVTGWNLGWLQQMTANIIYSILSSLGFSPAIDGLMITIPIHNGNWAAVIDWDCTGWKSFLAFIALVMATDAPTMRKIRALMFVPVIYVINLARIAFMFFYVRTYDLQYYQVVHSIVWSWGLIITILVLWILWMTRPSLFFRKEKSRPREKKRIIKRASRHNSENYKYHSRASKNR